MSYMPHAWRSNYPVGGYTIDFEGCTAGDISRFEIRAEILEEWKYCETPNEVYKQTNYARYYKWRNKREEK